MKSEGVYTPQHHPSVDNKSKTPMLIYTVKNISEDAVISLMFNTIYLEVEYKTNKKISTG